MLNKLAIRSILKLQHISPYFILYLYTAEVDIVMYLDLLTVKKAVIPDL